MRDQTRITDSKEADLIVLVMLEKMMATTRITDMRGDIPEVIDLQDIREINLTSEEITQENLEEALLNKEVISQDVNKEADLETSTGLMAVITMMLHHTEVGVEDDILHMTERIEMTGTSEISMTDQEEDHAALDPDITMIIERVDAAPDETEE